MTRRAGTQRTGLVMMLLFWVVLMVGGTWWLKGGLEALQNPNARVVTSAATSTPLTLERNRAGHFRAPGEINGVPVTFLLDTGATYVAVPAGLVDSLGLERGRRVWFNTANGRVQGALVDLDSVSLGGIRMRNVQGSVSPNMQGDTVLLGMSFLRHLAIEIREGKMVLTLPEPRGQG
ncbi:TIGR02281 family clan AA aspartic protease [Halomonas cibimaris]|uniref:TIGR02281 family clan AA aspartic protease n=1 Tax=Halomonas cibimaris TaxID=657012 RepID=A0ABP7LVZ2_9GAMM